MAGDKVGPGRDVEGDQRHDLLGLGRPAKGMLPVIFFQCLGIGEQLRRKVGRTLDEVGIDGVDLDLERRQLPGQRDGQRVGGTTGGRIYIE